MVWRKGRATLRRGNALLVAAAMAVMPALAASAASAPAAPAAGLQQQFDGASKAFEAGNWRAAADLFAQFRARIDPESRAGAVAAIREGYARLRLGEEQSAIALLESGLQKLPEDAVLRPDRLLAVQGLADGYESSNDLLLSAPYYRQQVQLAPDYDTKMSGYAGLARTAMFENPAEAIEAARQLAAIAHQPRERAVGLDLMGRAQLIAGRKSQAIDTFEKAVTEAGGLTRRIDQLDDAIRSDMALAGILSGNEKLAHLYLSATGAAQTPDSFLPVPKEVGAPICRDGASPEDMAVIEFAVAPDGKPKNVRPVYASGGADFAGIMARTVTGFRWDPQLIARLQPLQASMARLELHCVSPDASVRDLYDKAEPRRAWLKSSGLTVFEPRAVRESGKLAEARTELARREAIYGRNSPQLLPVLQAIDKSPLTGTGDTLQVVSREIEIARSAGAPPVVLANLNAVRLSVGVNEDQVQVSRLAALASEPMYRGDAEASAYLDWVIGQVLSRGGQPADQLRRAAETTALPPSNPIRRAANLRLADFDFSKDPADRRRHIQASGLKLNPCDAAELTQMLKLSSGYPELTQRWGFEGWVFVQFNVSGDSAVRDVVPSIAYPPLIFTDAAKKAAVQMRYDVKDALVPGTGCTGALTSVQFHLEP